MSSDLLAEFDSFYRAPQSENATTAISSNLQSTSALEDLSFFGGSKDSGQDLKNHGSKWNMTLSHPTSEPLWDNFGVLATSNNSKEVPVQSLDPWGSFETTTNTGGGLQGPSSQTLGRGGSVHERYRASIGSSKPGIIRVSTGELFSGNIADLAESTASGNRTGPVHELSQHARNKSITNSFGDILFDAADELGEGEEVEDDEFGDFEAVTAQTQHMDLLQVGSPIKEKRPPFRPSKPIITKNSIASNSFSFPYPQAPKSPSFQERNPFTELALSTSHVVDKKNDDPPTADSPVTAWPVYEPKLPTPKPYHDSPATNEEDWGDFADLPTERKNVTSPKGIEVDAWAWDTVDDISASATIPSADTVPPTNIPPPSVLLTTFPSLFSKAQAKLFQPVSNQPFALKNRILSDPSTIEFIRAYILLANVAARIIAGRKLRWKRDIHLSQGMKIGPAAASGRGGMKLSGVDKAEAAREDREAADLIRIWKEQVGRLRSAVATANSSLHDQTTHMILPEISENMEIRAEGGMTAPKACIVCGLKRDERISRVDLQVEDSFGEWWIEHWGHRACKNFWQEHEGKLKQR